MNETSKIIEEFNDFIKKWTGDSYPHLIDSDENDGERMRQFIIEAIEEARKQALSENPRLTVSKNAEKDVVELYKEEIEKAKKETAEAIFKDLDKIPSIMRGEHQWNYPIIEDLGIEILKLKEKYLGQETDSKTSSLAETETSVLEQESQPDTNSLEENSTTCVQDKVRACTNTHAPDARKGCGKNYRKTTNGFNVQCNRYHLCPECSGEKK